MIFYLSGNPPPRLAPITIPVPLRAPCEIDGENISNIANVAAALSAIIQTSSILRFFFGILKATIATIRPSTRYLIARLTNSLKSNKLFIT